MKFIRLPDLKSACSFLGIILFLIFFQGIITVTQAQTEDSPQATLRGWENNLRLFIKDRANNLGGFYYDRGLFRFQTVPMDMEYQLDIFTYQFSYFDDYEWNQSQKGFRSYMGSLNTPNFALQNELKHELEVASNGRLIIHAYHQENLRTNRGIFSLDYAHKIADNHRVGISHMLGQKKNDLDATFFYRYGSRQIGLISAEYTALDWANNFVSDLTEARKSEFEIRHIYSKKPHLFTLRLESPRVWIFRGEAVAAFQPESRAEVSPRDQTEQTFLLHDWTNYQAALLEADIPGGTAGFIFQRTFARMEREPAEGSEYELNYGNRQVSQRWGVYLTWRWNNFGIEQWFWFERNRDQQFDENPDAYTAQEPQYTEVGRSPKHYPFKYFEIRRFNKTKLFYDPADKLFSAFVEHNGDSRDPGLDGHPDIPGYNYRNFYHNHILERNERLTLGFGLTFSDHAKLTLGASIDLDGDKLHGYGWERDDPEFSYFDGGFGRLQITW